MRVARSRGASQFREGGEARQGDAQAEVLTRIAGSRKEGRSNGSGRDGPDVALKGYVAAMSIATPQGGEYGPPTKRGVGARASRSVGLDACRLTTGSRASPSSLTCAAAGRRISALQHACDWDVLDCRDWGTAKPKVCGKLRHLCDSTAAKSSIVAIELQQRVTRPRVDARKLLEFNGLTVPLWIRRVLVRAQEGQ
jgi:hypothetical protein